MGILRDWFGPKNGPKHVGRNPEHFRTTTRNAKTIFCCSFVLGRCSSKQSHFSELEKAVAVSGIFSGVPKETSGKSQENCWKIFLFLL